MAKIILTVIALILIAIIGTSMLGTLHAQDEGSGVDVLSKLREIINNQKDILRELSAMKEELRIIKIRATR